MSILLNSSSITKDSGGKFTMDDFPELKQNCEYKQNYTQLQSYEKRYQDTNSVYDKTWWQAMNVTLGICVLMAGIYYQR